MRPEPKSAPGSPGAPGRATGRIQKAWSWGSGPVQRVPAGQIPAELGRLAQALEEARTVLRAQRELLPSGAREGLDQALDDLSDVVFLADVERLVLEEHLGAGSAVAKVVGEVELLLGPDRAERARELGGRVVRGLEGVEPAQAEDAVILTRRLTVEDLSCRPQAIVTEEESPAQLVLELARALGVPVVTGAVGASEALSQGLRVEVDGGTGEIRQLD